MLLLNADGVLVFVDVGNPYLISYRRGVLCFSYIFCLRKAVIDILSVVLVIGEIEFELQLRLNVVEVIDEGLLVA